MERKSDMGEKGREPYLSPPALSAPLFYSPHLSPKEASTEESEEGGYFSKD